MTTAAQFLTHPIRHKADVKAAIASIAPKPQPVKAKASDYPANILTNYHYMCLLGREIADSFTTFAEQGKISWMYVNHINRGFSKDMDNTYEACVQADKKTEYLEDFEMVLDWFRTTAGKDLSDFQKKSQPMLQDALATILMVEYSTHSAEFITSSIGARTTAKTMRYVTTKKEEVKKFFNAQYAKVSNHPFDFSKFRALWQKINRMDYSQSKEFFKQ